MAPDGEEAEDDPGTIRPELEALGARLRAGFWYLGMGPKDVAAVMNVGTSTVHRVYRGSTKASEDKRRQMTEIALERGVPVWFLDHGWEGANVPDEAGLADEVQALRNQMDTVLRIIGLRAAGAATEATHPEQSGDHADDPAKDREA